MEIAHLGVSSQRRHIKKKHKPSERNIQIWKQAVRELILNDLAGLHMEG